MVLPFGRYSLYYPRSSSGVVVHFEIGEVWEIWEIWETLIVSNTVLVLEITITR